MTLNKHALYYYLQVFGWLTYVVLAGFVAKLYGQSLNTEVVSELLSVYGIGLITSHLYRNLIVKFGWTKLRLVSLVPRALIAAIGFALLFQVLFYLVEAAVIKHSFVFKWVDVIQNTINWAILYLIWSLIYFVYNYFENFKQEEIKNLRYEAARKDIELNKLKSQLNPHFIFNSMNTIRALIDEDPKKAKRSITQLSNILRNSLLMGRQKVISFDEELNIVNDYLEIEKTRFEERLHCAKDVGPGSSDFQVPVLMIQTLEENGIKHGVSKLPQGGEILLKTRVEDGALKIQIFNPGVYDSSKTADTGFGLVNTQQRLHLLYDHKASFRIFNTDNGIVCTEVVLPRI